MFWHLSFILFYWFDCLKMVLWTLWALLFILQRPFNTFGFAPAFTITFSFRFFHIFLLFVLIALIIMPRHIWKRDFIRRAPNSAVPDDFSVKIDRSLTTELFDLLENGTLELGIGVLVIVLKEHLLLILVKFSCKRAFWLGDSVLTLRFTPIPPTLFEISTDLI